MNGIVVDKIHIESTDRLVIRNTRRNCCNYDTAMCKYNDITTLYKWRQDYLQRCVGLK